MLSEHADIRVGGSSVDGVSRAGLNKIVGKRFAEGMRKPSRNGNPGELDSVAAHRLARHFLRARWRDPDSAEDMRFMEPFLQSMSPHQVQLCVSVLREFMQWRPGPAGRCRDRDAALPQAGKGAQGLCASKRRGDQVDAISVDCVPDVLLQAGHRRPSLESQIPVQYPSVQSQQEESRAPSVGIAAYLSAPIPHPGCSRQPRADPGVKYRLASSHEVWSNRNRHVAYEMNVQRDSSYGSHTSHTTFGELSSSSSEDTLHEHAQSGAYMCSTQQATHAHPDLEQHRALQHPLDHRLDQKRDADDVVMGAGDDKPPVYHELFTTHMPAMPSGQPAAPLQHEPFLHARKASGAWASMSTYLHSNYLHHGASAATAGGKSAVKGGASATQVPSFSHLPGPRAPASSADDDGGFRHGPAAGGAPHPLAAALAHEAHEAHSSAPALGFDDWSANGAARAALGQGVMDAPQAFRDKLGFVRGAGNGTRTLDDTYRDTYKEAEDAPPAQHLREMDERDYHGFDAGCDGHQLHMSSPAVGQPCRTAPLRQGREGGYFFD